MIEVEASLGTTEHAFIARSLDISKLNADLLWTRMRRLKDQNKRVANKRKCTLSEQLHYWLFN